MEDGRAGGFEMVEQEDDDSLSGYSNCGKAFALLCTCIKRVGLGHVEPVLIAHARVDRFYVK